MSSYGIGQGLERGVGMATNALMQAMQMKNQNARADTQMQNQNAMADKRSILALNWARAQAGLSPLNVEEARQFLSAGDEDSSASAPASGSPSTLDPVPSDSTVDTQGAGPAAQLNVPTPQFETSSPSPAHALTQPPPPRPSMMRVPSGINPFASGAVPPRTRRGY